MENKDRTKEKKTTEENANIPGCFPLHCWFAAGNEANNQTSWAIGTAAIFFSHNVAFGGSISDGQDHVVAAKTLISTQHLWHGNRPKSQSSAAWPHLQKEIHPKKQTARLFVELQLE